MSVVDEIKSRIDIVELVSQSVKLRKTGKNYSGFCPFHPNNRTPAFAVFPDSGTWRCFGQCNEGGDIFKYVMKKEGWDFPAALRFLAEKAGVKLEPVTPERQAQEEEHTRLRTLLEDAVIYYRSQFTTNPAGKTAFEYLAKTRIETSHNRRVWAGLCPRCLGSRYAVFSSKGYTNDELLQVGLITERDGGGFRDKFRNRIMFPIRDVMGKMCGFGARIMDPNDIPKFLNSPQTVLFDKGRLLYGLDAARKAIRAQEQAVIVEGYLDVIALHQCGFTNAVSPMGTALTEDQLRLLKRFTRRIVLALDADAAGEKATLRGLELAREAMDHADELVFDARGLLRHEARLQADVRVTTLPPGQDPDDVVLADPQEWDRVVKAAKPIVVHVMETLAASHNLEDAKEKREVAAQVQPLIEDVPDPVERDAYRQQLARLLKVDERTLIGSPRSVPTRRRPAQRKPQEQTAAKGPVALSSPEHLGFQIERHILQNLLRQPQTIYKLNRTLQAVSLARFSSDDFEHADHQGLANVLLQSLEQEQMDPMDHLQEKVPAELRDEFEEMTTAQEKPRQSEDKIFEELVRTVMRLRKLRIDLAISQVRYLQEEAQQQGGESLNVYQNIILQYTQARSRLDQALAKPVSTD